jgi:hypothetical protein
VKAYYAVYTYSFPCLTEFEVEKQTEKRIYPKAGTSIPIIGTVSWFGNYIDKNNKHLFWSLIGAYTYLVKVGTAKVQGAESNLKNAREQLEMLSKKLEEQF